MRAYSGEASLCYNWLQISHPTDVFTNTLMYVYGWIRMFHINLKMPVAMPWFVLFWWMCR